MTISNLNAINAYHKTQKAMNGLKSSGAAEQPQQLNILRMGDNLEIVNKVKPSQFAEVLSSVIEPEFTKIRKAEKISNKVMSSSPNNVTGPDLIGFIAAVNEAEASIQKVVAVRDKVLSAYLDIIKMPI